VDAESYFYILLLVFWFLSQLSSLAKQKKKDKAPPKPTRAPAPRTEAAPAVPEQQARSVLESLSRLESRLDQGLSDLDPRSRTLAVALIERDFLDEARRTRDAVERALTQRDAARLYQEIENGRELAASCENALKTVRRLSTARKTRDTAQPLQIADRLVDEVHAPLSSFAATALLLERGMLPPLAVVLDPADDDPIRTSPLARSTIFVPRSVAVDPLHWSLVAHEVTRWIGGLAPGLYQEIYEGLSLNVGDADLANDREALTRVLFGAYLFRLVGDGVGACLFGPTYLRVIARLYADPDQPARVTTIYLNQDGTVHPEPPAHLRVHTIAAWLTEMGFGSEAEDVTRIWDEMHGYPSTFGFYRSMGAIPAAVVLDTSTDLMAELHQLEIQRLAARTIPSLPGLADGAPRRGEWSNAKASFLRGEVASGSTRALLAAAMDAVLESPGSATAIRNALYQSVAPRRAPRKASEAAMARPAAGDERPSSPFRVSRQELVEALILGEVLLAPRRF
jgi:hypothetical protein